MADRDRAVPPSSVAYLLTYSAHPVRGRLPRLPLSSSEPTRPGRSLRSRRSAIGSADPGPAAHSHGISAYQKDGDKKDEDLTKLEFPARSDSGILH